MLLLFTANAQSNFAIYIKDKKTKEPLIGAVTNIPGTQIGNVADINGLAILMNAPGGRLPVHCKLQGYTEHTDTFSFPANAGDTAVIYLDAADNEMEEVVVSSTRSSRTVQDIPTRIELIGLEELDEKANMKPGDLRMLLGESTGIQTLQTSATSGNTGIRIQGLDGRYTQILKNGFPLYAGFSGGLGLLQTPPLDLKRVEIIKGASSTLYGGGAIAGLINLISKTPSKEKELRFLVNATSAKGGDFDAYYGQRYGKAGVTLYAAYNTNEPYTPDSIVFTAIPKFKRYSINPRLFLYPDEKTEITLGVNMAFETRLGGDIYYIRGERDSAHSYFEQNKTSRVSTEASLVRHFTPTSNLTIKNSFAYFNRVINAPGYTFDGNQNSTFTEVSYAATKKKHEWVAGVNVFSDIFKEIKLTPTPSRNYHLNTFGAFVQNTWDITDQIILESGLRTDYVMEYGLAVLPRVSVLYKLNSKLSSRVGGGLGYKAPTIFTEESERIIYRNLMPISPDSNKLEHSVGVNGDINYKTTFAHNKITFSINQLFFYTRLDNPLILSTNNGGFYHFQTLPPHIDAKGAETNIKIGYGNFKLFLGYTFTHSHIHKDQYYAETPLTPQHHTNSVLMYEVENKWKIGLEAYYYSTQHLSDITVGRDYWLCGFMAERLWKQVSLYINFENMLDSRQTRFGSIYTGSITQPVFRDIYAPLDGFVINGGIKLHF